MNKVSLRQNALYSTLRTALNVIFPLLTYPYITRVLSVENIGRIDFSKSIVAYFLLIAGFGIAQYGVREGSRYRDDKTKFLKFCNEIFSINILFSIISYILLGILIFQSDFLSSYTIIIAIFSVNIIGTTLSVEWVYTVLEDFRYITIRTALVQVISLILLFVFVKSEKDYLTYALITVFSFSGTSIINFLHVRKFVKLRLVLKIEFKNHFTGLFIFFVNSIASIIYLNSDITLLGLITTSYYVGLYSVATKVYTIFKQVANSVLLVSTPRLSNYAAKNNFDLYSNLCIKMFNFVIISIIPLGTLLIVLSKPIINILAGTSFERSAISLSILSLASVFSLLSSFYVYAILLPFKKEKLILYSTISSALLNIILNLILIPYFQEIGAAISTLFAEISVMVLAVRFSKNISPKLLNIKIMITSILGSIVIFITGYIVGNVVTNQFMLIILTSVMSLGIYLIILDKMKIIRIQDLILSKFRR
ncbi:hypothetical protein IGJ01_002172 [Enterococcus sp. AZ089]|uniref:Polysaccharide biosynthesis protein n=2 Tax=Enterococcus TaxID=1350 RepID=F0EKD4_ENTCA|nr:flippase [Enterococcus casseliflavus]EGC69443.1 polysaccharide biosynthesis protein [Enterococcus casseliflavus ATCC 12755]UOO44444.1 flippase [Enterococcus casseliflavus]